MKKIILIGILISILMSSCKLLNHKTLELSYQSLDACYRMNLKDSTLMTGFYYVEEDSGLPRKALNSDKIYKINPYPIITAEDIEDMYISKYYRQEDYYLDMLLGERGALSWKKAMKKPVYTTFAFIVNNELLTTVTILTILRDGWFMYHPKNISKEELEYIKKQIENNIQEMKNK